MLVVNSWKLYNFILFSNRLTLLEEEVNKLAHENPDNYKSHPKTKLLASVFKSIRETVPANPNSPIFQLGLTLGCSYTSFRRVKKGLPNRYRLFFKFSSAQKDIVYVWLNDEFTLRKDGDKNDVYAVFKKMLESGKIPVDINDLMATALV